MGVVYEAFDHERSAAVALKTLRRFDAPAIDRFKKEFRALADIEHQNLVRLFELHCEDGVWFFTMELLRGESFRAYVRPGDEFGPEADTLVDPPRSDRPDPSEASVRFDERRLRASLTQLCRGVAALHGAGKIHRDIKPGNVMVTSNGRAVLLDFGLVTDTSAQTGDNVVGTAYYMAPEQAASKPVGPAADWYAVGSLLYEALTGRTPFAGSQIEILMNKQRFEPPPPRHLVPDVPRDLDALCTELLRIDPGHRPVTAQILERLGVRPESATHAAISTTFTQTTPFVGREREMAALATALTDSRDGNPITVLLRGESGIGKSTIVRQFIDDHAEALAFAGRCYERESVPYKAFDGIVDHLSRHLSRMNQAQLAELLSEDAIYLARIFPTLRRVPALQKIPQPAREVPSPQEARTRAFAALRQLLGGLGEKQPLILAIDDLQWADRDSVILLADLLHPPDPPPFLLCSTVRTSDTPAIRALRDLPGDVRTLEIAGLSASEARQLAEEIDPSQTSSAIAEESRGHPLFLLEILRYVAATGARAPSDIRLDEALWARISRLDDAARRVLETLAIAGAPIAQRIAAQAANIEPSECGHLISALRAAFLVRTGSRESDSVETYHDRVREAVLARMDGGTRERAHLHLAMALEAAGPAGDPRLLVQHLEAAGQTTRAAQQAEKAAFQAAQALAFDESAELFSTALRLGQYDAEAARRLRILLGDALANAGRGPEAAEALLSAADGADGATRLACEEKAAEQFLLSGHLDRGTEALRAVLEQIGVSLPRSRVGAVSSLLWHRAVMRLRGMRWRSRDGSLVAQRDLMRLDIFRAVSLSLSGVDPLRANDFEARHLLLALRTGQPRPIGRGLALEAIHLGYLGRRARAHKLLERAEQLASEGDDPYVAASTVAARAFLAYFEGRFAQSAELFDLAERSFRESTVGTVSEISTCRIYGLMQRRCLGACRELRRRYDEYVRDAARRGDRYLESTVRRGYSMVWLVDDRPDEARLALERASWIPPVGGYHLQHWYAMRCLAEADLYEGRSAGVFERFSPEFTAMARSLLLRVVTVRIESRWLRARLCFCGPTLHLAEAKRLAQQLADEGIDYPRVFAHLISGAARCRQGDTAGAASELREAIPLADRCQMGLSAAAARWRLSELIGGDEGRALRAEADAWMAQEGIRNPARMIEVVTPGFTS